MILAVALSSVVILNYKIVWVFWSVCFPVKILHENYDMVSYTKKASLELH